MKRILIVSIMAIVPHILAQELSDQEVILCLKEDDPVERINTLRPDILIIDSSLLHTTAFAVLQEIDYKPPTIILLTSLFNERYADLALSLGVTEVTMVPFSLSKIVKSIQSYI